MTVQAPNMLTDLVRPDHEPSRGECRIVWRGASSPNAYVPSHVPRLVFSGSFLVLSGWTTIGKLLRLDLSINPLAAGFTLLAIALVVHDVLSVLRDRHVSWEIGDRGVTRRAAGRGTTTPLADVASIEVLERTGGRGDLIVRMPERRDSDGDTIYPSIRMLDIPDVRVAAAAVNKVTAALRGRMKEIVQ